jgi:hypothetical protein
MRRAGLLMLGLALVVGCSDGVTNTGGKMSRILLTDAPFPYDQVQSVDVYIVSIEGATTLDTLSAVEWTPLATPDRSFNLLDVQDGQTAVLGETEVNATQYAAIRMTIRTDLSSITLSDGTPATVNWMGPATQVIHAAVEQPLSLSNGSEPANLIIDFDVGRSFVRLVSGEFQFLPWIRAVNETATGAVKGTVVGPDLQPVQNGSVILYRVRQDSSFMTLTLAATGRTNPDGSFKIHYVSGGGPYRIEVAPPTGLAASHGYADDIYVTQGQETSVGITLGEATGEQGRLAITGPRQVAVGQAIYLYAFLFNESGDSVFGAPVTWANSNSTVAQMDGSGEGVKLTGLAVGTTSVVATSGDLMDSIVVTVGDLNAPVASVEVLPSSLTLAVGDSTGFQAILRDAVGNVLTDRTIGWSVDSGVVQVLGTFGNYLVIRAVATGTTTIRASAEGKQGTATVVVQ